MDDAVDELTRLGHQTEERRQRLLALEHRIVDASSELTSLCSDRDAAQVCTKKLSASGLGAALNTCVIHLTFAHSSRAGWIPTHEVSGTSRKIWYVQGAVLEAMTLRDQHQRAADAAAAETHGAQTVLDEVRAELATLTALRERHGKEAAELSDACADAEARLKTLREEAETAESQLRCVLSNLVQLMQAYEFCRSWLEHCPWQ